MIFDISFMLGRSHTAADTFDGAGVQDNLMLLRAARAARVGARAGRLSRVIRMLRYMPFLKQDKNKDSQVGIAKAISGQLANLLATRIACLTIVLVMVIPMFDLLTFPQIDFSLKTWAERLSQNLKQNRPDTFKLDLNQLVDFYSIKSYGPYRACLGFRKSPSEFTCTQEVTGWTPIMQAPPRGASVLQVTAEDLMISFNMHATITIEAGL